MLFVVCIVEVRERKLLRRGREREMEKGLANFLIRGRQTRLELDGCMEHARTLGKV